jgi:hypothetical protein
MRGKFRFKSNSALSIALAAGLVLSGFGLGGVPAEAKGGSYSASFTKAAMPVQTKIAELDKLKGKAGTEAQLASEAAATMPLADAAAAAASTNQDKLAAGQFLVSLGGFSNDMKARQRGVQLMIDSGMMSAEQLPQFQFYLGNFAFGAGDYATSAAALKASSELGYGEEGLVPLMIEAYNRANLSGEGVDAAKAAVAKRQTMGQPVPEKWLRSGQVSAYNAKNGPEAINFSILLIQNYPSAFNWLGGTQMVRSFAGLDPQSTLDLFRLMDRSGALDNEAKYVENEYKEYVETADPRKNPGEVVSLLTKASANGRIGAGGAWARDARAVAEARIAPDKASLPGLVRDASAAKDGKTALIAGDVALNYGDPAQAEAMYQLAATKGGVDLNTVMTRLGIAQFDQGKYADADASFAKVTGPRQSVAKLWQVLIGQRKPA